MLLLSVSIVFESSKTGFDYYATSPLLLCLFAYIINVRSRDFWGQNLFKKNSASLQEKMRHTHH